MIKLTFDRHTHDRIYYANNKSWILPRVHMYRKMNRNLIRQQNNDWDARHRKLRLKNAQVRYKRKCKEICEYNRLLIRAKRLGIYQIRFLKTKEIT